MATVTPTTRSPRPGRRRSDRRRAAVAGLVAGALALAGCSSSSAAPTTTSGASTAGSTGPDLAGVTLRFADQFKQYQTVFAATHALAGAPYRVEWSDFVGGPPIVAAETGGSVDLGDMAETPTIFAQAAGDPVKVVAATQNADPSTSPFALVVPAGSPVHTVAQLAGKTVAVQEGTVEQYVLIRILAAAGLSYHDVTVDNLSVVNASAAVSGGKVDAALISQPLIALDEEHGSIRQLASGAGVARSLGYLTASQAALDDPTTAAAIVDFVHRFYRALSYLATHRSLTASTYATTFGIPLAAAREAADSAQAVGTQVTPAIISYQQAEADEFLSLGLLTQKLDVRSVFDLPLNRRISAAAGLHG